MARPELCALYDVPLQALFGVRSDLRTRLGVTEARAHASILRLRLACIDGPLQVRVTFDMIHLDARVI